MDRAQAHSKHRTRLFDRKQNETCAVDRAWQPPQLL